MQVREVGGSRLEIAEFRAEDTLQQLSDCLCDTVHFETCWCSYGKCQQCMVEEGLTWRLSCWRDEVQKNASAGGERGY